MITTPLTYNDFSELRKMYDPQKQEPINIAELVKTCSLTLKAAVALIGRNSTEGKVMGVTSRPSLRFPPGLYITCSNLNETVKHFKVGEEA